MSEPHRTAHQINMGARFAPAGILGALLKLAEQHQREGESLEAAFSRVVRQTDVGRRLYSAFREAEAVGPSNERR